MATVSFLATVAMDENILRKCTEKSPARSNKLQRVIYSLDRRVIFIVWTCKVLVECAMSRTAEREVV